MECCGSVLHRPRHAALTSLGVALGALVLGWLSLPGGRRFDLTDCVARADFTHGGVPALRLELELDGDRIRVESCSTLQTRVHPSEELGWSTHRRFDLLDEDGAVLYRTWKFRCPSDSGLVDAPEHDFVEVLVPLLPAARSLRWYDAEACHPRVAWPDATFVLRR